MALVAQARARGVDVTCETCPHYLVLDADDAERLGAVAKCAPPLRAAGEREALWAALRAGDVDLVATDHSPAPAALKEGDDFFAVWGGIAGAQTLLALLYDEGVVGRGLAPAALAELLAAAPARRFGLAPAKGALAVGADADVALVDPAATWTVAREELLDRHRLSPFVGRTLRGRVVRTILRGRTIARDGRIVGAARRARGAPRRLGLGAVTALHDAIAELAQFNDDPAAGGITREVYTPTYATALEWVAERMRAAGLETRLDAVGNLFGRWTGSDPDAPIVLTGSHVDTTLNAGALRRRPRRARRDRGGARPARGAACARGARSRSSPGPARSRASAPAAWAAARPRASSQRADLDRLRDRDGTSMADALRERGLRPRPAGRRAHRSRRACTRSSSCTSSRASCSRPTASRSASSPRSPRRTTSA